MKKGNYSINFNLFNLYLKTEYYERERQNMKEK